MLVTRTMHPPGGATALLAVMTAMSVVAILVAGRSLGAAVMTTPMITGDEERLTVSHQFQQARGDTAEWLRLAASTLARLTAEAAIVTVAVAVRRVEEYVDEAGQILEGVHAAADGDDAFGQAV